MDGFPQSTCVLGAGVDGPVLLLSVFKPILMMVALMVWAWGASRVDEDLWDHAVLPRRVWNGIGIMAAVVGFGLWLMIPWFWLGLPVGLAGAFGPLMGYSWYRNAHVPVGARWSLPWESLGRGDTSLGTLQSPAGGRVMILGPGSEDPVRATYLRAVSPGAQGDGGVDGVRPCLMKRSESRSRRTIGTPKWWCGSMA